METKFQKFLIFQFILYIFMCVEKAEDDKLDV